MSDPATLGGISARGVLRLARGAELGGTTSLREVFALALQPGVISFAIGLPGTDLFPAAELAEAAAGLLSRAPGCLQYALPSQALKAQIAALMAQRGVACSPGQVFLTTGAQQGMDLLAHLLLDPGGQVMIERTIYECALGTLCKLLPEMLIVPNDAAAGLDVDAVEASLAAGARPAFLYTIPEAHNPLGVSLGCEPRRRLAELARRYEIPILEDDAYGFLAGDAAGGTGAGAPPPALRSFDNRWVLYLGSFSKILAPALRVGWLVVPEELVPRLQALKQGSDIDTATLSQALVSAYLEAGHLPAHLKRIRAAYRERRDATLRAMAEHLPPGVRWNRPAGGIYLWVELPAGMDAMVLLKSAAAIERVAFSPGAAFAAGGGRHADSCLRLSFADLTPERIDEGIQRLGRAVRRSLAAR